ncbi:TetR/AcrR family transcriptional regulator [Priestia koreensis]|uniref:TetR/AcrR family transcriptional regulator n=1 Tax=Priestia koreensis TaxID=284581 RepID=UPI001F5724A9|nr:TetR/AcrR family transcriptional regulator [Priestia koreensis]UNL87065.1 TetR/AcrR family transcriptional regulator [Priestia koreensis]
MDGFKKRTEQKKQAILTSAFTLFFQNGVKGVNISQIAKQAGVSQVTIYNYFESKENLLLEVIKGYAMQKHETYEKLVTSDMPFKQKVEKLMNDKLLEANEMNPLFLQEILDLDPRLTHFFETFYQHYSLPLMMKLLEDGKNSGDLNADFSLNSLLVYLDMFQSYFQTPEKAALLKDEQMRIDVMNLFFYGLMKS